VVVVLLLVVAVAVVVVVVVGGGGLVVVVGVSGQGYGYILYSTPIPSYDASASSTAVVMAGMRDRAHIFFDHELHQTCDRGTTVDTSACTPPLPQSHLPQQLDILVENMGRVTGGLMDSEIQWRGINRYVAVNGQ
jgi:hypothetical protein